MSQTNKKFIIIDGNALIHRSFHALPPTMTTKKGEMVNAVYGFTAALLKALRDYKPNYVALTLDKKGPTFRHKEYALYKATRVKAPDDLYKQIPYVKAIAKAFNIPIYEMTGFEADDLIGTIAKKIDGQIDKIILTGDLDTLQLVNEHTKVYTMSRGIADSVVYDKANVIARFGLTPEQMIDFKALRGDPSDNIPGVKGIGEKTATELLKNFKTLDKVYKNINSKKVKERTRDLLTQHKKDAYQSKKLATIKCDVIINFNLDEAIFGNYQESEIVKILSELEFKSLLPRVQNLLTNNPNQTKEDKEERIINKFYRNKKLFKYYLIENDKQFLSFLNKLKKEKNFTFDVETSSFDPITANLLGISFSWQAGIAYYLNFKDKGSSNGGQARNKEQNLFNYQSSNSNRQSSIENRKSKIPHPWLEKLKPIFANENIKKFGHNIKFDVRVIENACLEVNGVFFDTMVASYLLNPGSRQHNLDILTFSELGYEKISKDDLLGKGREKINFSEVSAEKLSLYSGEDADFTNRLVKKLKPKLKEQKLDSLFNKIEIPLIKVLAEMENNGILINKKTLAQMNKKISENIKKLKKKIYKQAGQEFNINSTQQLREILFEKLAIPTIYVSKTKTGLSTAADELNKLKDEHPIIKLIQEYRELMKLITTYIDALPKLINKKTGRIHTSFNQTITATGRLSSTEPNLQNIPIRTELGREIRKAFIAAKGYRLVSLDYSQIELRLAAHMSNDKKMIKAFQAGADIHTATAAEINQVSPDTVTSNMRREAKAINFGILYGQGPHGLSQTADIPYARAKDFIDQYFIAYKDIKKFIEESIELARKKGYAETLFNRRRYLPEINSSVLQVKKAAERMATNTPLQGTAADMIKIAMIEISSFLERESNFARMLLQVHDELLFEIKENQIEDFAKKIKKIMENVIKLKVPVIVDVSVGDNWGEMKKLEV